MRNFLLPLQELHLFGGRHGRESTTLRDAVLLDMRVIPVADSLPLRVAAGQFVPGFLWSWIAKCADDTGTRLEASRPESGYRPGLGWLLGASGSRRELPTSGRVWEERVGPRHLVPDKTDLCSTPSDSGREVQHMPNAGFSIIPSVWGEHAGNSENADEVTLVVAAFHETLSS